MAQIVGIFQSLFYSVGIKLNESVCASLVMNNFHHIKNFRLCYVLIVCGSVAATNILGKGLYLVFSPPHTDGRWMDARGAKVVTCPPFMGTEK